MDYLSSQLWLLRSEIHKSHHKEMKISSQTNEPYSVLPFHSNQYLGAVTCCWHAVSYRIQPYLSDHGFAVCIGVRAPSLVVWSQLFRFWCYCGLSQLTTYWRWNYNRSKTTQKARVHWSKEIKITHEPRCQLPLQPVLVRSSHWSTWKYRSLGCFATRLSKLSNTFGYWMSLLSPELSIWKGCINPTSFFTWCSSDRTSL